MKQWRNFGDSMSKGEAMWTTLAQGAVDAAAGVTTDRR
jgi:hypothetical protein